MLRIWITLKNLILALVLFTSAVATSLVNAETSDRIALVIGNNQYSHAPLLNPVNDANAIGRLFREMDYDYVRIENNTTRLDLEAALDEFSVRAENAEIAVIYYAGHGIQVDGENYLIPIDITLHKKRDVRRLVSVEELSNEVSRASRLGLIILDACRDNPFVNTFGETLGRSTALPRGLHRTGKLGGNTLVAYATEANAIADDGTGKHSPYTTALIRHIGTPLLEVRRMFGKVRDDVLKETQSLQRPFVYGSLGGDEIFLNDSSSRARITRADVNSVGVKFIDLKNAIINKDLIKIGSLTSESADRYAFIRKLFKDYDSLSVTLSDVSVHHSKNEMSSAIIIEQLVLADGSIDVSTEIPRSIPVRITQTGNGWSRIQW